MKKSLKKILLALSLSTLLLTACSSEETFNEVDLEKLATDILETKSFDDELVKVESSVVEAKYFISDEDSQNMVVYMSSNGATPEEIALFSVNSDQKDTIEKAIDDRIQDLKISFESYAPDEMYKLEEAVVTVQDGYVYMVISNNSNDVTSVIKSLE